MKKYFTCWSGIVFAGALACANAADWYGPQAPFAVYGNTHYVGTEGLSTVLVTSPLGHILIDAGAPKAPPSIVDNIRKLGFKVEDIRYILISHEHHDHVGGLAALQKLSNATVLVSPAAAAVISSGQPDKADPQVRHLESMTPVAKIRIVQDGEVVKLGELTFTAHFTPGHTKGGTSWTWQATQDGRTVNVVYADSLFALSSDSVRFSENPAYPNARTDIERSIAKVASLTCDVLIAAHPESGGLWERQHKQSTLGNAAFIDQNACRNYAAKGSEWLAKTLAADTADAAKVQASSSGK